MEAIYKALNDVVSDFYKKDDIIKYIESKAHEKLQCYNNLDKVYIEEMIEDGRYEEVISKLQSVIEELEAGYCVILDKIEGNYEMD